MLLRDLVIILAAAVAVMLVFRRLQLPAIAGFIVAGAALVPTGFGWVRDLEEIRHLAEIGVVLLLFTVGLESPLSELRRLGRVLTVGGGLQVGLTTVATAVLASAWGAGASKALFLGFLVALSSTAIVLRQLAQRNELHTLHGRLTTGVLLFQDLAVILPSPPAAAILARTARTTPRSRSVPMCGFAATRISGGAPAAASSAKTLWRRSSPIRV